MAISTPPSADILSASAARIADALGVGADKVTITTGDPEEGLRLDDGPIIIGRREQKKFTTVVITAEMPGAAINPEPAKDEVRMRLAGLAPLAGVAQMVPDEDLAPQLAGQIRDVTKGTNFEQKLLEAPIFDPKVMEYRFNMEDYMVNSVTSDAYGQRFNVKVIAGPNEEMKPLLEKEAKAFEANKEKFRASLMARAEKYIRANMAEEGKNAGEIEKDVAKAKEDMGKLLIMAKADENRNGIGIYVGTQAQSEANAKDNSPMPYDDKYKEPSNAADLKKDNPLNLLKTTVTENEAKEGKSPQMHKALGRAMRDSLPVEEFVKVAGRRDIKAAIFKELMKKVLPAHSDKADDIKKILDSDLFKNHGRWRTGSEPGSKDAAAVEPVIKKYLRDGDKVTVYLTVPNDKLTATFEALANAAPGQDAPAADAPPPLAMTAESTQVVPASGNSFLANLNIDKLRRELSEASEAHLGIGA